jgi:hypothetical protein
VSSIPTEELHVRIERVMVRIERKGCKKAMGN